MGKGDKKSRKGKIAMGSYGKTRPHSVKKKETPPAKTDAKKDPA
ncbi:MAG: 30S ribosomal protein THX [Mucilaginibacter polytrichastri]|nr:30S ribosomal protein THX [Mucilaginibacter polytrichastri]